MEESNKIKFALYLKNWNFDDGDKNFLRKTAEKIPVMDFVLEMKGHIFCPECTAPLFRSPEDKNYASDGRKAFYAHSRSVKTVCSLRVKQGEGKRYENEEEAKKAIEDGELVIVQAFMRDKPVPPEIDEPLVFDREPNEDQDGELTPIAIGRHNGDEFKLPSKVTTIRGLCRAFDENLNKYFMFPGQKAATTLQDLLIHVGDVKEICDVPRLYFGRITHSANMGKTPKNIRQTFLHYPSGNSFKDFCLKATDESSREHGIGDESIGRIAIAYGRVTVSGIGLCISNLGWGEFALLPRKYEYLLDDA